MGIEGVENLTPDDSPAPPLPDDEVVEEQKREEEGIEPSEPVEVPAEVEPTEPAEAPAETLGDPEE